MTLRELCEQAARTLPSDFTDGPGMRPEDVKALSWCDDYLEQALHALDHDDAPIAKVSDLLLAMREKLESIQRDEWSQSEFAGWFTEWREHICIALDNTTEK